MSWGCEHYPTLINISIIATEGKDLQLYGLTTRWQKRPHKVTFKATSLNHDMPQPLLNSRSSWRVLAWFGKDATWLYLYEYKTGEALHMGNTSYFYFFRKPPSPFPFYCNATSRVRKQKWSISMTALRRSREQTKGCLQSSPVAAAVTAGLSSPRQTTCASPADGDCGQPA